VPVPITRYRVPGHYLWGGLVALALAGFFFWFALIWPLYWIFTGLFLASAGVVLYGASRPAIEIYDSHVKIGDQSIPWRHIRRLDRSANMPLMVRLTLSDKTRILVIFPGNSETSSGLLRSLRRHSRDALIDGVPYRQFWGESAAQVSPRKDPPAKRQPLLLPEDEAEVERMFQRLKSVGHLDQRTSSEDK